MAKTVIVINGSGKVGKNTFVSMCNNVDSDVVEVSAVDFIKVIATKCGWNGDKTDKDRKFLSDLKDLTDKYNGLSRTKIKEFVKLNRNKIVFIHVRNPEDIEYYKNKYKAITLLIRNDFVDKIDTNHADANVENYDYDCIIENNGTLEELQDEAQWFLEDYMVNGFR